jgi:hypothetical protein
MLTYWKDMRFSPLNADRLAHFKKKNVLQSAMIEA